MEMGTSSFDSRIYLTYLYCTHNRIEDADSYKSIDANDDSENWQPTEPEPCHRCTNFESENRILMKAKTEMELNSMKSAEKIESLKEELRKRSKKLELAENKIRQLEKDLTPEAVINVKLSNKLWTL